MRLATLAVALLLLAPAKPPAACAGFCAGFGWADITPPPGPGLAGNGPEGKPAAGYRTRLFARALVMQDEAGDIVALVVADLAHVSPELHRRTATLVEAATGIGPAQLVISATHTHAGPGHFYSERQYNTFGSSVPGYDSAVVKYLADAFAAAIRQAADSLRPARAAWGQVPVWGFTRNRSYPAYRENAPGWSSPFPPPPGLDPLHTAVDPSWTMIRVDLADEAGGYHPAGALSLFAIHGTANPPDNDLFDADIHGALERGLERHIDAANGRAPDFRRGAVHLVANGTEGDVSPDWPASARCRLPRIQPALHPGGPRTPAAPWEWHHGDPAAVALCIQSARRFIREAGDSLTARAIQLYEELGRRLTDSVEIAVAFRADSLPGRDGLCEQPFTGVSTTAGAEDGPTRLRGWRLFGLFNLGFEEGGSAINPEPRGCHREKRIALGETVQGWLTGPHALAEVAQLSLVRFNGLLLAAVPAEVTTVAGYQLKAAIADSARAAGLDPAAVALVNMANGYIQYVTTDAEYRVQHYEGGSTIYGPRSAAVLAGRLGALAGELGRGGGASPPAPVMPLEYAPGDQVSILPSRSAGPEPAAITRRVVSIECRRDTVTARWVDAWPGRLFPADGPVLSFEVASTGGPRRLAWDDDPAVEVRGLGKTRSGWLWEVRWSEPPRDGRISLRILPRRGFPEAVVSGCDQR